MIEQKHSPLVRGYLGYERFDTVAQTLLINRIYDKAWWHYNFFQPVLRLEEKIPVYDEQNHLTYIKRRYDQAQTPFDRLCETNAIQPEHRDALARQRDRINPRRLRQEIYDLLDQLFALPGAIPGITEKAFATLLFHPQSEMPSADRQVALYLNLNCTPYQNNPKDDVDASWP